MYDGAASNSPTTLSFCSPLLECTMQLTDTQARYDAAHQRLLTLIGIYADELITTAEFLAVAAEIRAELPTNLDGVLDQHSGLRYPLASTVAGS